MYLCNYLTFELLEFLYIYFFCKKSEFYIVKKHCLCTCSVMSKSL